MRTRGASKRGTSRALPVKVVASIIGITIGVGGVIVLPLFSANADDCASKIAATSPECLAKQKLLEGAKSAGIHRVIFDTQGGTEIPEAIVADGAILSQPAFPEKLGYTFTGWLTKDEYGELVPYDFSRPVNGELILTAQWRKQIYEITFVTGTSDPIDPVRVTYGQNIIEPETPTRGNAVFLGWFIDQNFQKAYDFTSPVTEDLVLYAKWDIPEYRVIFDSQGGSLVSDVTLTDGQRVTQPDPPRKAGFAFAGWFVTDEDGELMPYEFTATVTSNITLVAKWQAQSHHVHFVTNGGSSVPSMRVISGETIAEPNVPERARAVFLGWFTDKEFKNYFDFTTAVTDDLVLYARWEINEYRVTFDTDGGTSVPSIVVEDGDIITQPIIPTRLGYAFTGWFVKDQYGDLGVYEFTNPITQNTTLYAGWQKKTHHVHFASDGGSDIRSIRVVDGETIVEPSQPKRHGAVFLGWFTDETFSNRYDFSKVVTGDMTLYAKWNISTYKVTFDAQGGTQIPSVIVEEGQQIKQPSFPTKKGYAFTGWFILDEDDEPIPYEFTAAVTKNITLFANWQQKTHHVHFHAGGGSLTRPVRVNDGDAISEPVDPEKDNAEFLGWYTDKNYTQLYDFNSSVTTDMVLYAKWYSETPVPNPNPNPGEIPGDRPGTKPVPNPSPSNPGGGFPGSGTPGVPDYPNYPDYPEYPEYPTYPSGGSGYPAGAEIDQRIIHTVAFITGNGTSMQPVTIKHGDILAEPEIPESFGQIFLGWYTQDENAQLLPYDFAAPVLEDLTLYALWQDDIAIDDSIDAEPEPAQTPNTIETPTVKLNSGITENSTNILIVGFVLLLLILLLLFFLLRRKRRDEEDNKDKDHPYHRSS